ncbi:MAG: guanylate kinase [Clostridiales bacterium]|nr:guanylate kinase [Clostridiales bacterium]
MSRIYIIIGKSATGKDTIYKKLLEMKDLNLKTVVMYTTRPIRVSEVDGVEYHFVDEKKLEELKKQNRIIEHRSYNTIHGKWHYFTVNDDQFDLDKYDYLIHGTLSSYSQIRDYFGAERVVPLYIEVEDGIRLMRALKRERKQKEPKYAELCRRFLADDEDFSEENIAKQKITKRYKNIDINVCLYEIRKDIQSYQDEDRKTYCKP